MRKRNKPFLLATLLVVFVGAAVAMNEMMMPKSQNTPVPEEHTDEAALEAPRTVAIPKGARAPEGGPPEPGRMGIVKPKATYTKPTPSDSMTSGQWYTKEYGYKGEKPK
jgi:hypothetical protein